MASTILKPAKPVHNRDIVSLHFNNFSCMGICDKHLSMLTYIYLDVGVLINIFYLPANV